MATPQPPVDPFRPVNRRQRLVIALLAVGTTLAIGVGLLAPHVDYLRAQLKRLMADVPACAPGQLRGCTGGIQDVFVVETPAPASAAK